MPYVPSGILDANGEADVTWAFGQIGNGAIPSYWVALTLAGSNVNDISNVVCIDT